MTHTFPVKHSRQTTMPQRTLPARLLSPIRIPDGLSRPSPSSATSPCSPIKRRRAHHNLFHQFANTHPRSPAASSPARQRHCKKPECCIVSPLSATPFDDLPWISLLDHYPSPTVASPYEPSSPWDLADLPIPIADCCERPAEKRHSGGPGPIRSRKSTARLRCVPFPALESPSAPTPPPLSAVPELSPSKAFDDEDTIEDDTELFSPFLEVPTHIRARTWSGSSEDSEPPRTPPPRAAVLPALVDFRNLMPVSPSDEDEDASSKCTQEDWSL